MKASFVQLGQAIDFVPSRDIAAGEVLTCNGIAGIVKIPVKAGCLGALHLSGVFDIEKADEAVTAGDKVFFNTSSGKATVSSAGNVFLGIASASSTAGAQFVRVILNFGHPDATGSGSSDGIEWQSLS